MLNQKITAFPGGGGAQQALGPQKEARGGKLSQGGRRGRPADVGVGGQGSRSKLGKANSRHRGAQALQAGGLGERVRDHRNSYGLQGWVPLFTDGETEAHVP